MCTLLLLSGAYEPPEEMSSAHELLLLYSYMCMILHAALHALLCCKTDFRVFKICTCTWTLFYGCTRRKIKNRIRLVDQRYCIQLHSAVLLNLQLPFFSPYLSSTSEIFVNFQRLFSYSQYVPNNSWRRICSVPTLSGHTYLILCCTARPTLIPVGYW